MEKPTQQEMFDYLNELRESGATNMFGASPYLMRKFNLSKPEAMQTLSAWMEEFKKFESFSIERESNEVQQSIV